MPLEISEIGVRLSVGEAASHAGGSRDWTETTGSARPLSREQMDEIVRACVTEALARIRMAESR